MPRRRGGRASAAGACDGPDAGPGQGRAARPTGARRIPGSNPTTAHRVLLSAHILTAQHNAEHASTNQPPQAQGTGRAKQTIPFSHLRRTRIWSVGPNVVRFVVFSFKPTAGKYKYRLLALAGVDRAHHVLRRAFAIEDLPSITSPPPSQADAEGEEAGARGTAAGADTAGGAPVSDTAGGSRAGADPAGDTAPLAARIASSGGAASSANR